MVQRAFTVLFEDNVAIVQGQLVASHLITLSPHFLGWQTMMTNTGIHIGCCQGKCNHCNRTTFRANMQTSQPQFLHCIFCHRDILCLAEHKDIMGLKDWVWFQGLQTRNIVNPNLNGPAAGPHLCDQGQDCISESLMLLIVNETCDCVRWNGFPQDEDTLSSSAHHIQCKGWANYVRGAATGLWDRGRWYVLKEVAVMARAACCFDGTFHVKCIKVSGHDLLHLVWWGVIEAKVDSSY